MCYLQCNQNFGSVPRMFFLLVSQRILRRRHSCRVPTNIYSEIREFYLGWASSHKQICVQALPLGSKRGQTLSGAKLCHECMECLWRPRSWKYSPSFLQPGTILFNQLLTLHKCTGSAYSIAIMLLKSIAKS